MSEPFIGEIRMMGFNFAPRSWAFCDGQLLAVSQNDALFSLYGTIYGGDGRTTFGLPDLRGRTAIHLGQGPGLSNRREGSRGGAERVTLVASQLPAHSHTVTATSDGGNQLNPSGHIFATAATSGETPYSASDPDGSMNVNTLGAIGGSQSHSNIMPSLVITFCCALVGIFPSRT